MMGVGLGPAVAEAAAGTKARMRRSLRLVPLGALLLASAPVAWADPGPHNADYDTNVPMGVSGGNIAHFERRYCYGGTLGALVQRDGTRYILGNNHVLARTNKGQAGEDIVQPGLNDSGCRQDPGEAVGDLSEWVELRWTRGRNRPVNYVDAAVAQARANVDASGRILDIGTPSTDVIQDNPGLAVKKSGRTTGLTTGRIQSVNVSVSVDYGGGNIAYFEDQFTVTPGSFSDGGDSGSLIVEDVASAPRAVGLLYAGSDAYTLGNPICRVLGAFGITMVGSGGTSSGCPSAPSSATNQTVGVKERHKGALLQVPGGVGVGVGVGDGPGESIDVYVAHDDAESRRRIPAVLENVPVRVIVGGEFRAR